MVTRKKSTPRKHVRKGPHVEATLQGIHAGKTLLSCGKDHVIYRQGDHTDAIYFIETGKIKISVGNAAGKEAVLALHGPGDFFGEGCIIGQSLRLSTATTREPSSIFRVEKTAMIAALAGQHTLSQMFIAHLVARNIDLEEDLSDQLFNHSEKRLARVLLKLARVGPRGSTPDINIGKVKQDLLAEMVGTTRPRISEFMTKFRKLGLIEYDGDIIVRAELLIDAVLHD